MKRTKHVQIGILIIALIYGSLDCFSKGKEIKQENCFAYDIDFLHKYDSSLIILKAGNGKSQIAISPKYQSKVFTSTANGMKGKSFGWINYKAFSSEPSNQMNAFGGENRLWLGPEGGIYSLFFKPKTEMVFSNWHTPTPIDIEPWTVLSNDKSKASLTKQMSIENYKGNVFSIKVEREIKILSALEIAQMLNIKLAKTVHSVAYQTDNKIINTGNTEWNEKSGVPCIWMLDMLKPTPNTIVVVPFRDTERTKFKDVATTNYFGEIPANRLKNSQNVLFFKADGKHRSKLGVKPNKAKPIAGSYDADGKTLTIILFDLESEGKYLNQEWNTNKEPFSGDAMNTYNDGPLADRSQMGPFYEIESVSPAAFLKPNECIKHKHSVFHFVGSEAELTIISKKLLGVSIKHIKTSLN